MIDLFQGQASGDVVDCARAGLIIQLKEAIGTPTILFRQEKIVR